MGKGLWNARGLVVVLGLLACSVVSVGVCASAALAQADDDDSARAVARQLGAQGIEAYQNEEYGVAETKLDRAYKLFAIPTLALWSARARLKMGRWVEASERYREATRASAQLGDVATQKQAQAEATRELEELLPRIPSIVIQLEGAEPSQVSLQLDASPVSVELLGLPRPTNPGAHVLTATWTAQDQPHPPLQQRRVRLLEGEQTIVRFAFRAPSKPTPSQAANPDRALPLEAVAADPASAPHDRGSNAGVYTAIAIPALALGALGLVTWGATGIAAMITCSNGDCRQQDTALYNTLTTVSTVGFYAGSALVVGGVVTWLLAPSAKGPQPSATLSWAVGPGGVSMSGAF